MHAHTFVDTFCVFILVRVSPNSLLNVIVIKPLKFAKHSETSGHEVGSVAFVILLTFTMP